MLVLKLTAAEQKRMVGLNGMVEAGLSEMPEAGLDGMPEIGLGYMLWHISSVSMIWPHV